MATLERQPGVFQNLVQIWDAGSSWVLVQDLQPGWTAVRARFADPTRFSEKKLRQLVFQVAAIVHFLHRHGLSLAGELVHYDLMVSILNGLVNMLDIEAVIDGYARAYDSV